MRLCYPPTWGRLRFLTAEAQSRSLDEWSRLLLFFKVELLERDSHQGYFIKMIRSIGGLNHISIDCSFLLLMLFRTILIPR